MKLPRGVSGDQPSLRFRLAGGPLALRLQQGDSLLVEADKLFRAHHAFVGDGAVGKIAAIFEYFQARFDSRTVQSRRCRRSSEGE